MKIEVGNYVRYTRGAINGYVPHRIGKVLKIDNVSGDFITLEQNQVIMKSDVIKSSPNIIDLIEVGDYVNGFRVEEIEHKLVMCGYWVNTGDYKELYDTDIETIVTKEQFKSIEYKVEE